MILELLSQDGFSPKRKGTEEYCSPCPSCGGDDRFVIWTDSDRYWCRQCETVGDAIEYLRNFHDMSFQAAAEAAGRPGLLPQEVPIRRDVPKTEQSGLWRRRMGDLSNWAHMQLMNNSSALEWLRSERGITQETAARFRLGWIDRNYYLKRQDVGLDDKGRKLFIPSGLAIPWQNVRVRIRRDNPGENGRYYVVPGSKSDPFIIGNFHKNTAVILESELDAILLAQETRRPLFIVALGSAQMKPDDALIEMLTLCPVVLVALDNDDAGAKSARWWLDNLGNAYRTLSPRKIGKDISEGYLNGLNLNQWLSVSVELCSESICV